VDKRYVDEAAARIGARFYMLDAADATVATYKQTSMSASALATATVDSPSISSSTDTEIEQWISPSTMTFASLASGVYDLDLFAQRISGNRTCQIFWRFYERLADNSEVLIAQSNIDVITTVKARQHCYCALSSDYTPTAGSRLVGKVYVRTTGSGSATVVRLYYQGDEDSHWQIPVSQEYLEDNFVQKAGDTMTGALIVPAHEATGLIPQVMNGGYCAIGDLPDVATVPEGTFFFILP
jgi:hypothetical protein